MKKIKTFEDACAALGINPTDAEFTTGKPHIIAHNKLEVVVQALNEGWQPDWNNTSERKWQPWFYMGSAGAGFRLSVCVFGYAYSGVGSRLCLKSEEVAEYAAKQFADLYKAYMTL